jgi:AraC family transcriptional regulator
MAQASMGRSLEISKPQETRRAAKFGDFVLSEIVYPPGFRIDWHQHELAAFAMTLNGSTSEVFSRTRVDRTEGGLLVRPAGERHRDSVGSKGARCFLIEFDKSWIQIIPKFGSIIREPMFHTSHAVISLMHRAHREWLVGDTAAEIAVQALAMETAVILARHSERANGRRPPVWLRQVKQRIDEAPVDTPSLAEIAKDAGVHPGSIALQFRRHYGASIGEYLRSRRLEAARRLLIETDVSLIEIALSLGFANPPHFSAAFRRFSGWSPSQFRRLHR